MAGAISARISFLLEILQRPWVRALGLIWAASGVWDLALSEWIPEPIAKKLPRVYQVVAMTTGLLPWEIWLLIGALIVVVAAIEYAFRHKQRSETAPNESSAAVVSKRGQDQQRFQAIAASVFVICALAISIWYAASITPKNESKQEAAPASTPEKATHPLYQSTHARVIYRCRREKKTPTELENDTITYKNEMDILGDTLGYSTLITHVLGGIKIEVTPRTEEMRQQMNPVTKYSIQVRYLTDRTIVLYVPEVDTAALQNNFALRLTLGSMVVPGSTTDMETRGLMTRLPGINLQTCELF